MSVLSLHVRSLYRLFLGVHPVNPTVRIINGNTIGPNYVLIHKHLAARSIQISTLNLRHGASISPVYFAAEKIDINYQLYTSLWNGTVYKDSSTLILSYFCFVHNGIWITSNMYTDTCKFCKVLKIIKIFFLINNLSKPLIVYIYWTFSKSKIQDGKKHCSNSKIHVSLKLIQFSQWDTCIYNVLPCTLHKTSKQVKFRSFTIKCLLTQVRDVQRLNGDDLNVCLQLS